MKKSLMLAYGFNFKNKVNSNFFSFYKKLAFEVNYTILETYLYTINFAKKINFLYKNISIDYLHEGLRELNRFYDRLRYFFKKHIYTINHKRIALNYFYFSMWTGLSGAALATMIRLEMAYPGSPFFKGDSIKYLQVATAHGLIMVFFVVVPIYFGGFANFLIPYHVGSKDVAFPRLNSIGFWIQPLGFILVAKIAFLRTTYWHYYDKTSFFLQPYNKAVYKDLFSSMHENTQFNKISTNAENSFFFFSMKA